MLQQPLIDALNDLCNSTPALRAWIGGPGLGSILNDTLIKVDEIEDTAGGLNIEYDLSFSSPNEVVLSVAGINVVEDLLVQVETPFSQNALVSVGTDANPELFMTDSGCDLGEIGLFKNPLRVETDNVIKLYFLPGGSVSGQAKIIVKVNNE